MLAGFTDTHDDTVAADEYSYPHPIAEAWPATSTVDSRAKVLIWAYDEQHGDLS